MKTAFVTGATAGIGAATARALAGAGWRVIGTGRRADRLTALADELGADRFLPLTFDVADAAARDAAIDGLPADWATIDLLVNNAGLARGTAPAQSSDLADWARMIDTNISALVALTHRLLPGLVARRGAIINLSSVAATYPYPGGNVYGGTKAFVRQFSLGLRSDLAASGVRVCSIEPGMVETEFSVVRMGSQDAADKVYAGMRPLDGDDIARTILWVAGLPPHININALELMPVAQAFAGFSVAREE